MVAPDKRRHVADYSTDRHCGQDHHDQGSGEVDHQDFYFHPLGVL
jgi:hypothetical protein